MGKPAVLSSLTGVPQSNLEFEQEVSSNTLFGVGWKNVYNSDELHEQG